MSFQLFQSIIF